MKENTDNTTSKRDWSWVEPTNEEFERKRVEENFYKLYCVDENGENKTLYKFWGRDDADALRVLEEYKADHQCDSDVFYSSSLYYVDGDGKRHDSLLDMISKSDGIFEKIGDFFKYDIPWWWRHICYWTKGVFHYARMGHSHDEWWSIYDHILDDLKYNLPILKNNRHGVPTRLADAAAIELGKSVENGQHDRETMDRAFEMWERELEGLLENVLLYRYYSEYGIVGENDPQMAEIDRKYEHTLPYLPGTDKHFDYDKLNELSRKHWNAIWDWMKKHGEELWD